METAEYQAGLFDSISYAMQAQEFVHYIDRFDYYKNATRQLVVVYNHQDLKGIEELTKTSDVSMLNYLDLLLYHRNRN